ncbi:MAG: hypothetical protein ACRDPO_34220 [Streptosporangiaceae bacterium]
MHWNGKQWSSVKVSGSTTGFSLAGVHARSATDAWAVGQDCVTCTPFGGARSAWTVGSYQGSGGARLLLLHWNGKSWSQQ